ncbi:hypothetical protein [Azotobacter salinestris]|uniref:hypothetical protein n=1 Tax=Azotobacter salinestris TaxID=69964 RepID=UPI0032DF514F
MRDGCYSLESDGGGGVFVQVKDGKILRWDDGKGEVVGTIFVEERDFCWTRAKEEPPQIVSDTVIRKGGKEYHYCVKPGLVVA